MASDTSTTTLTVRRTRNIIDIKPSGIDVNVTVSTERTNFPVVYRQRTWTRTPGFTALKRAGTRLPDNPFSLIKTSLSAGSASFEKPPERTVVGVRKSQYIWAGPPTQASFGTPPPPNYSKLNSKLVAAAQGNQWNVPVVVGELRSTVSMVANAAFSLVHMASALRRGDLEQFARSANAAGGTVKLNRRRLHSFGVQFYKDPANAASSAWLQYSYGWVPLVHDVSNAMNTLMDTAENPDHRTGTVEARIVEKVEERMGTITLYTDPQDSIYVYGKPIILHKTSLKGVWRYEILASDIPGRFGLLNPLSVAWELVPFSFVADWFLPVGDYLNAFDTALRFKHAGGTYGYKLTSLSEHKPSVVSPVNSTHTGFGASGIRVAVQRQPMGSLPSSSLLDARLDPNVGAARAVSAIALLQSTLGLFGPKR